MQERLDVFHYAFLGKALVWITRENNFGHNSFVLTMQLYEYEHKDMQLVIDS